MSESIPDYYAVLGVARSASEDEIRRAYRRVARLVHPDRGTPSPDLPNIRIVNEASDVLGDPVRRAVYDQITGSAEPPADADDGWPFHPDLPDVPEGFGIHPRPAWGAASNLWFYRFADFIRVALSLYAKTPDLSNLSHLADDDLWLLDLQRLPVKDSDLQSIARFRRLEVLLLDDASVTDAGLEALRRLPVLERLSLSGCRIGDEGAAALAAIHSLQNLELDETRVTDAGLAAFEGHPGLIVLDIRRTKVRGSGLEHLVDLPALRELRVSGWAELKALKIFRDRPEVNIL